jgi:hypothetical protein
MKTWIIRALAAALAACAVLGVAQDFPTKPVRAIVSFTPGSATVNPAIFANLPYDGSWPPPASSRSSAAQRETATGRGAKLTRRVSTIRFSVAAPSTIS